MNRHEEPENSVLNAKPQASRPTPSRDTPSRNPPPRSSTHLAERRPEMVLSPNEDHSRAQVDRLNEALRERDARVAFLEDQTSRQGAQIGRLEDTVRNLVAQKAELIGQLRTIKATKGWRVLELMRRPYRRMLRLPAFRRAPR